MMIAFKYILVAVMFLQYVITINIFKIKLFRQNITFTEYERWSLKNIASPILCAWQCSQDKYCVSLLYSPNNKECISLGSTYQDLSRKTNATPLKNYNFYKTQRAAPKVGSVCDTGRDCMTIPAADCYSNQCRCQIGHSLGGHNTCRPLSGCRRFSNRFESYKRVVAPRQEGRKFPLSSKTRCMKRCLRKRRSPCISFDIDNDKNCYLQLATIFDVHHARIAMCDHYQRICNW